MMLLTSLVQGETAGYIIPAYNVNGAYGTNGDGGPASSAQFKTPMFISYDPSGAILITDAFSSRVRRVDLVSSIITTIAGNGFFAYSGDGGLATSASLNQPSHALYGSDGCTYIADTGNNVIRKVDAQGVISTFVGNG